MGDAIYVTNAVSLRSFVYLNFLDISFIHSLQNGYLQSKNNLLWSHYAKPIKNGKDMWESAYKMPRDHQNWLTRFVITHHLLFEI